MNGYQMRTEKKKEQIMKTTFDLISKYGVDKTSITEISKHARVSPVSIYNYFGSKEELVRMTFVDYMSKIMNEHEKVLDRPVPFQEKLELLLGARMNSADPINVDLIHISQEPSVREYIEDFYQERTIPFFVKLIEQGKQEGFIDPEISIEAALFYIQMFKEALARPGFITQASSTMLSDIDRLFYYGLLGRSEHSETERA